VSTLLEIALGFLGWFGLLCLLLIILGLVLAAALGLY
jgi:hypothetical protein